jgi:glycosyltransferase involved in cell wall biosynthesis
MKISIALPIHKMSRANYFLVRCLDSIIQQSFEDFEVVITDNSDDDELYKIIRTYGMKISYYRNPRKGMAQNTNEAIKRSKGELIKIIYMDDYFAHEDALKEIVESFKGHWLISPTDDNRHPRYTTNIHVGNNKLGSPSALTILNKDPMLFDEEMTWLLDCDYYRRMFDKYGAPVILKKVNVNLGVGRHQMTHILTDEEKLLEHRYMKNKYE